jgi:hypothetical protein
MKKMKTSGLISVVAIAMALTLTITFSGVALASHPVPPTDETEKLKITTTIDCTGAVVESQGLSLEIDSVDLLNNLPLANNEKYGKIGYVEKMIGSDGTTTFCKTFVVDTGTAPNLAVTKSIGYTQTEGELGSLSHEEQLGMKAIFAGEAAVAGNRDAVLCPFDVGDWNPGTPAVPGSCEEVNTFSKIVMTDVQATTETSVGITGDSGVPVNLDYRICASGTGFVVAGVSAFVADGRGAAGLGSRMSYREKTIGYGDVITFDKKIGYESVLP